MEIKMVGFWVALGLMVMSAQGITNELDGITCGQAFAELMACSNYLVGNDETPSAACCLGVQKVNQQADTPQVRKDLCVCFKAAAPQIGVKPDKAKQLPDLCHVSVPVTIDPNVDCNSIKE